MPSPVIDRVRSVIERVAESQAAFGEMVGISKDKLSKSLSGTRRFTSLELAMIADVGGVTVDWLLTGRAPVRPAFAARTSVGVAPDVDAVAVLTDRYAAAYEVLALLDKQPSAPELPAPPDGASLRGQGTLLASWAHERLAAQGFQAVPPIRTSEFVPIVERVFGTDVVISRLPSGLDGLAWQTDHRRLILIGCTERWTRQRFTLAHELGHILAGDAQQVVVDQNVAPGLDKDPAEVRANWFAAALLMPHAELRARVSGALDEQSFARLVVDFGVSPSAMAVRLRSLGLISQSGFEAARKLRSTDCHRLAGALDGYLEHVNSSLAGRLPTRLVSALLSAYYEGETTLRPLANLLDIPVDDLYDVAAGAPDAPSTGPDPDEPVYSL